MYNICILGGTAEGRMLAELLISMNANVDLFVAEERNTKLIQSMEGISVFVYDDVRQVVDHLEQTGYALIVDATGQKGSELSLSVQKASAVHKVELLRFEEKMHRGRFGNEEVMLRKKTAQVVLPRKRCVQQLCSMEDICEYILGRMVRTVQLSRAI